MLIDPTLLNALLHSIAMLGWLWGWIRHPLLMFSGLFLYFSYLA
ncbi:hypothetical protein [Pseudomonas sp. D2002]|nr:hypothetical protein [Pseudomonas sp. D2002]